MRFQNGHFMCEPPSWGRKHECGKLRKINKAPNESTKNACCLTCGYTRIDFLPFFGKVHISTMHFFKLSTLHSKAVFATICGTFKKSEPRGQLRVFWKRKQTPKDQSSPATQYIRLDERASTSITLLFFSLFPNQMSELFAAGACSPTHQRISARKVLWNVVLSCHLALNVLAVLKNWARGVRRMWTGEVASAVCASLKTELGTLFRSHKVIVRDAGPRRGRERWSAVFDTDGVEGKRT